MSRGFSRRGALHEMWSSEAQSMVAPSTPAFQIIRIREHLSTSELRSALCIGSGGRQPDPSLLHMLELGLGGRTSSPLGSS